MSARVVSGGLQTTVQDLGRAHAQRHAVPVGGAMDTMALRLANLLVGNEESAAGLEATLIGPALEFDAPTLIAICGADLTATIDSVPLGRWRAVLAPAGVTLRFARPEAGCRAYVAFAGGIDVPEVFGSRATYLRGAFGGVDGRALRDGDEIAFGQPSQLSRRIAASLHDDAGGLGLARWYAGVTLRPPYSQEPIVRVIPGAHADSLDAASRTSLFGGRFRVSASSDRMGYRLEGPQLQLRERVEMLSEGVDVRDGAATAGRRADRPHGRRTNDGRLSAHRRGRDRRSPPDGPAQARRSRAIRADLARRRAAAVP